MSDNAEQHTSLLPAKSKNLYEEFKQFDKWRKRKKGIGRAITEEVCYYPTF